MIFEPLSEIYCMYPTFFSPDALLTQGRIIIFFVSMLCAITVMSLPGNYYYYDYYIFILQNWRGFRTSDEIK